MLSFISFTTNSSLLTSSSQPGLTLQSNETACLVISFNPPATESLGDVRGFISISSLETSATINFRFVISSTNQLDLILRVEDEYTYFSEDRPFLSNAKIALTSKYGSETLIVVSNATGFGLFTNITEGYYDLYTSAGKHLPDSRIILASPGQNSRISVFLQRIAVTYSWVVKPVPLEDRYDIALQADFTTYVPIPVVIMEPTRIDLEPLEIGLITSIQFKITNYGLIAAKGFIFDLPSPCSHPYLTFTMNDLNIGDIPANTTLYAVVNVNINETLKQNYLEQELKTISKRSICQCLNMLIKAVYYYICDEKRFIELMTMLDNSKICQSPVRPIDVGKDPLPGATNFIPWLSPDFGWGSGSDINKVPNIVTPINCNCALNYPLTCWEAFKTVVECIKIFYSPNKLMIGYYAISCYKNFGTIKKCVDLIEECELKSGGGVPSDRSKITAQLSRGEMGPIIAHRSLAVYQYYNLGSEYVGDHEWFYLSEPTTQWWSEVFEPIFSETSEGKTLVTLSELNNILKSPLPSNATQDMVKKLVLRYNESFYNWEKGDLNPKEGLINFEKSQQIEQKLKEYEDEAKKANKESIVEWFKEADDAFNKAEEQNPEEGVCAKVRIQIQQRITLTRIGFEATLTMENGETSTLNNIKVEIKITTFGQNSNDSTDKFAIGKPTLTGITDVTGSGKLDMGIKGTATWLIIPYSSAAPKSDVQYNVGGILYYSIGTENLTVPLFPDTITVKPDPRLVVNYFLEKYVYSDDPFTPEIEPAVPFTLGILISNEGYGSATSLTIVSSQPEIIDNEKGLLVNFKIIGTQMNDKNISPSLTINFGDISPHTTRAAKWIMTCSLSGTFSNFSATFQNINPLGDHKLSVLEKVEFLQLLHTVMIDHPKSDSVSDFLIVDPENNQNLWPYLVYDSSDGTRPLNVSICNATIVSVNSTYVKISANCSANGWVYLRVHYPSTQKQFIVSARRNSKENIDVEYNAWMQNISKKNYLQIFDYLPTDGEVFYEIFFTKLNLYAPVFSESIYRLNVSEDIKTNTTVLELRAYDQDSNHITYIFSQETVQASPPFTLDSNTGMLVISSKVDRELTSLYNLVILAIDDGTPQRTGTAFVSINVTDVNDNAPQITGIPSHFVLEDITPVGFSIGSVKITDSDAGQNAQFTVTLTGGDVDMLDLNLTTGTISTNTPLNMLIGKHNFYLVAEDLGIPPLRGYFNFTIDVIRHNSYKPVFNQSEYNFYVNETNQVGSVIGKLYASDEDNSNETLTYEIVDESPNMPFTVNRLTGEITNKVALKSLDNETTYSFEVLVSDDGSPPTGKLSSSTKVIVHIIDINDNPPKFPQSAYTVRIRENTVGETVLLTLKANDADFGVNSKIYTYLLEIISPNVSANFDAFKLNWTLDTVQLVCVKPLDREEHEEYILTIEVVDAGSPPLSSIAKIRVIVDDENDCIPYFQKPNDSITVSSALPINTILYNLNASDCDLNSQIYYILQTSPTSYESSFVSVVADTGVVRLHNSLVGHNFSTIQVNVKASDGKFVSETFYLSIVISDVNTKAPAFKQPVYNLELKESLPERSKVITLSATDEDSAYLYFEIISGNEQGAFSMNLLTGDITLVKRLDFETTKFYKLIVVVFDNIDKSIALNGTAEIIIKILNVNEFPPVFENAIGLNLKVMEGVLTTHLYQFIVSDKDRDSITFSIIDGSESLFFSLNETTGWLAVVKPLNKSVSPKILIQIKATDNGVPPLSTIVDVVVDVLSSQAPTGSSSVTNTHSSLVSSTAGDSLIPATTGVLLVPTTIRLPISPKYSSEIMSTNWTNTMIAEATTKASLSTANLQQRHKTYHLMGIILFLFFMRH